MTFSGLIQHMIDGACRGDGAQVAACFTPDGAYHDVFYGSFRGRAEIARMIGASRTTVAVILHRARNRLQKELSPIEGVAS